MSDLTLILAPIFLIIIFGYILKHLQFLEPQVWNGFEKLVYFVSFPALLIHNLSTAQINHDVFFEIALTLIATILFMTLVLVLASSLWRSDLKAFTSVFQGGLRFNSYIGLAIVAIWLPDTGVALAAIAMMSMIPLLNVLCVLILKVYATHTPVCWRDVSTDLVKNPLIIGCVIGISLNILQIQLPQELQQSFKLVGQATLPLGLLAVGAALELHHFWRSFLNIIVSSGIKLVIFPLIVLGIHAVVQFECHVYQIVLLFSALPTATSSYILAKQLGGDAELMANIISAQVVLSLFSLPWILWLASC
ncbi:AEC family transporter [Candidatus Albibeggiatoa sp. nov. NOAA]|uniref:AEC family transporter n=1 Tax=Candidatus Albibeggiatoa sp. nov. NOAA TaxID=3162724 RepID=UPI003300F381|nr:AEC family transporter [Thiotrichaceae bacterium]